jgi:hypothetical protein
MALQNKFNGHNIVADEVYIVPASSQGWIANNTDVTIQLDFGFGRGSVGLVSGQVHNWNTGGNPIWQYIVITVAGMGSGFVGCCWSS